MAKEYADKRIQFVFVYTREAHPGENYPCHENLEQKIDHARAMVKRWGIERSMLVDDLEGTIHHAYGRLPNMSYVIDLGGKILFRAAWTDARIIRVALDQLQFERDQRRQRIRTTPYYMEWLPQRVNDHVKFMEGLLADPGPRAVTEFIDAVTNANGKDAARPIREWWAAKAESQVETPAD